MPRALLPDAPDRPGDCICRRNRCASRLAFMDDPAIWSSRSRCRATGSRQSCFAPLSGCRDFLARMPAPLPSRTTDRLMAIIVRLDVMNAWRQTSSTDLAANSTSQPGDLLEYEQEDSDGTPGAWPGPDHGAAGNVGNRSGEPELGADRQRQTPFCGGCLAELGLVPGPGDRRGCVTRPAGGWCRALACDPKSARRFGKLRD